MVAASRGRFDKTGILSYKAIMASSPDATRPDQQETSAPVIPQLRRYLADRRHWRNTLYVALGGYGLALAGWSWCNQADLPAFVLHNQPPAGGALGLPALLGSVILAWMVWLLLGGAVARRGRQGLDAALGRLSALFLAISLLAFLPVLAIQGIETEEVWLTPCLVAAMAFISWLATDEYLRYGRPEPATRRANGSTADVGLALTAGLAVAYAAFMIWLTLARHASFLTHAFDLGIQDQAFHTTLNRGYPLVTLYGEAPVNQFGDHFTPLYYLLAPLYLLVGDARALLVIQALFLGLAAIPLYLLARQLLPGRSTALSVALAASFLLHPALHGVNTFDFHEIALAPMLLLWALVCLESGRTRLMLVFLGLAMLAKEEVALSVAAIGLYLWLFGARARLGLLISGVALAYFGAVTFVIMPALGGGPDLARFAGLAAADDAGLLALLSGVLSNPVYAFSQVFLNPEKLAFLALLFLPVVFTPLRARARWLTAVPAFSVALLASTPVQYSIEYHYPAIMLPFVYYLAAAGLRRGQLQPRTAAGLDAPARRAPAAAAVAILVASLAMNWQYGWLLGKRYQPPPQADAHRQALVTLLEAVPPQASVSTLSDLAPHLSNRDQVYLFPVIADAEFILFDSSLQANFWPYISLDSRGEAIANLLPHLTGGDYGLARQEDGVLLLQRNRDASANAQAIATLLSPTYSAAMLRSADSVQQLADAHASWGVAKVNQGKPSGQEGDVGLLFGPYARMQPGRYLVTYRLKLAEPGLAGRVATVDVFSHAAGGPLAGADLEAAQFTAPGRYQEFAVELEIREPLPDVEYRVGHSGLGTLAADSIQVTYLGPLGG